MADIISVYQHNTFSFTCSSPIDATGYTPYFTVKRSISDTIPIIDNEGTVTDPSTLYFTGSSTDSSLASGDYPYDITMEADASIYTINKGIFRILDGVRY